MPAKVSAHKCEDAREHGESRDADDQPQACLLQGPSRRQPDSGDGKG